MYTFHLFFPDTFIANLLVNPKKKKYEPVMFLCQ